MVPRFPLRWLVRAALSRAICSGRHPARKLTFEPRCKKTGGGGGRLRRQKVPDGENIDSKGPAAEAQGGQLQL